VLVPWEKLVAFDELLRGCGLALLDKEGEAIPLPAT
jgi:hypothetical protein